MKKRVKKLCLISSLCGVFVAGSLAIVASAEMTNKVKYAEDTTNIKITKNVDLYTYQEGKYSGFADPWGVYYSGGTINKATGWLYESDLNGATIELFDEVIGDFSIVMQPIQEVVNSKDDSVNSGTTLNWDYLQFVFTDKADSSNVFKVDLYESGWYTYNIELNYKGMTYYSENYSGESFGGRGNSSYYPDLMNVAMRVSLQEVINRYYKDFTYRVTGMESYSVSMALGVKNWGNNTDTKKLMVYELCGQKLSGETLTDNKAPQFIYSPFNGVANYKYTSNKVIGGFDVIDGKIPSSAFEYAVYDMNGNNCALDDNASFIPQAAGEYTLKVAVADAFGNKNEQEYPFEIFEEHPDATFTFGDAYKTEYALNTPLTLIRPASVVSNITNKAINYRIELYCGLELVKTYKYDDTIIPVELNKVGDYKILYVTDKETGGETVQTIDFSVSLRPYIPELEDVILGLGEKFETGIVYATYNGQKKLMEKLVYAPNGQLIALDKDEAFVANELGEYSVKYTANFGDVIAEKTQKINCKIVAQSLFTSSNGIDKILYNRDTTMFSVKGNGMEVYALGGSTLTSKTVDLDLLETHSLIKVNAAHYENIGTMSQMTLSLVDAHNSSNSVELRIWQSPWAFNVVYVTYKYVSKNGDVVLCSPNKASYEKEYGTSYTGTTVGGASANYSGAVHYGYSLKGGMKGMNFLKFEFDYKTGTFYQGNKAIFSISDPNCVGAQRVWKGFTDSQAYMQIKTSSGGSNAYNIVEFLGQSLSGEVVDDKTAPYFGLLENDYFLGGNLPKAIVGKEYEIPAYYAVDYFAGVKSSKVKAMDRSGNVISISNGTFTPTEVGTYFLYYEVIDNLGNRTEQVFEVEVVENRDYFTIDWVLNPKDALTGDTYVIPKLKIESEISNVVVEETIFWGDKQIDGEVRTIRLMGLDDIVVRVIATDYLGNVLNKEYVIEVNPSPLPVLDIERGMPNSAKVGEVFSVPSFNVYNYNYAPSETGYLPEKWIEVNGVRMDSLTFTVTEEMFEKGALSIVYCGGEGDDIARSEAYIVSVIDPTYIGDYFVKENTTTIVYERTLTKFVFSGDATLSVANNLATSGLMFKFGVDETSNANAVTIRIEDFMDSSIVVLLTITPMNNVNSYLTLKGADREIIIPGSFANNNEFFTIYYNDVNRTLIDTYGNLITEIKMSENGNPFSGFTSGSVRVSFIVDCAENGNTIINMYKISNQNIINPMKSGEVVAYTDKTKPVLQLESALQNVKLKKGTNFILPAAKAYDFCQKNIQVALTLRSPSGVVFSDKACNEAYTYRFEEYGEYEAVYTMTDGKNSYTEIYRITVVDDTTPSLTVENTKNIAVKVGQSFVVPSANYGDGVSAATLYVFLVDEWNLVAVEMGQSIQMNKAGHYRLRYYVVDEAFNTAEVYVNVYVLEE